jgi:hypothetical protein
VQGRDVRERLVVLVLVESLGVHRTGADARLHHEVAVKEARLLTHVTEVRGDDR